MKSKIEARIERRTKRKKPKSPVGGKALQRLFFYLGQRDPKLNDDVVATIVVPKAARPKFGLTKKALRAKPASTATAGRMRRGAPAAKSLAAALAKAATALTIRRRRAVPRGAGRGWRLLLHLRPGRPLGRRSFLMDKHTEAMMST